MNVGSNGAGLRILIVRVGAMGDVLHGMPAVAALRTALPDAVIGWAVEPRWAPLLSAGAGAAAQPLIDTVHRVEAKAWSKHPVSRETFCSIRDLRQELRAQRYDLAIDLQGSIRSALIARASGASRVVGSTSPRESPARWLYTQRVPIGSRHVIEQAAEIVSVATQQQLAPATALLPVDAAAEAWCETFLVSDPRPAVFLAPTAGWGAKQWPAERYGRLAQQLFERGCRVLVNASPHGTDRVADAVVQHSGGTAAAAACTLSQLIALLRRVRLVVAGDSGPLHLAAALGVPVVALFGPTDPVRNGPYATTAVVLRHASSQTDHRRHAHGEAGLQQIAVAEVLAAALQQLSASTPAHG
ncbi:MAG: lipopolysaccharide heptosyltransferase I [Janthinobacterium lividum]